MKILLIADIHSNWPALSAIREDCDSCLCVGDFVDYATDPVPCIEWARSHVNAAVRGNHDHAVAQRIQPRGSDGLRQLAAATRPMHWQMLSSSHMRYLARLPVTQRLMIDGKSFYLVHATPRDPLDEYLNDDKAAWRERLAGIDADFVCVGHTHIPFHLDLGRTQVINPGSVGQPRDGDPRASYAVIENGQVELRRVTYNVEATLRQMQSSGVQGAALHTAETLLRTGGLQRENGRPRPDADGPPGSE